MLGFRTKLVVGVLGIVAACGAGAEEPVQIALSGLHLTADKTEPGEGWWGIYPDGEGFTLQPTTVSVEAVRNPADEDDTNLSALSIEDTQEAHPVLLVRGLPGVQSGPLKTASPKPTPTFLSPGQELRLSLKSPSRPPAMHIVATGSAELEPGKFSARISNYQLHVFQRLDTGAVAQVLITLPELGSPDGPRLWWAGDLDRDGKLDLVYDLSPVYVTTELALFLSSAAKEGELVGLVARWNAQGNC